MRSSGELRWLMMKARRSRPLSAQSARGPARRERGGCQRCSPARRWLLPAVDVRGLTEGVAKQAFIQYARVTLVDRVECPHLVDPRRAGTGRRLARHQVRHRRLPDLCSAQSDA